MRYMDLFWNCLYVMTLGSLFGASMIVIGKNISRAFDKNREEKESES